MGFPWRKRKDPYVNPYAVHAFVFHSVGRSDPFYTHYRTIGNPRLVVCKNPTRKLLGIDSEIFIVELSRLPALAKYNSSNPPLTQEVQHRLMHTKVLAVSKDSSNQVHVGGHLLYSREAEFLVKLLGLRKGDSCLIRVVVTELEEKAEGGVENMTHPRRGQNRVTGTVPTGGQAYIDKINELVEELQECSSEIIDEITDQLQDAQNALADLDDS